MEPKYIEYGHSYHKVESRDKYIDVTDNQYETGIRIIKGAGVSDYILKRGSEVSKKDFSKAYHDAFTKLNLQMFLDATEPATPEEIREKVEQNSHDQQQEYYITTHEKITA